jgi:hypothetical protein
MPEPHDRLSTAFTEFAMSVLPDVRLPGPEAAHVTVRRRRRRRLALVAASVAVVILAPASAYTLLRPLGNTPPDVGTTPPTASPTLTPSPAVTPSVGPSPSSAPPPAGLRIITDGLVGPPTPLDDARLPLPPFGEFDEGCPQGETQYTDGVWEGPLVGADPYRVRSWIGSVATGDVNQDGLVDWVASVRCRFGPMPGADAQQIVAFTRRAAGPYELVGRVLLTDRSYSAWPTVTADGTVRLAVHGPYEGGSLQGEWRSFRWDGLGFVPTGAPEAIPAPEPTDLVLTVSPTTISGSTATLTVTVHNRATTASDFLSVRVELVGGAEWSLRLEGSSVDLQPTRSYYSCDVNCSWDLPVEPVPPGQTAVGRFTVTGPSSAMAEVLNISVVGIVAGLEQANATTENYVRVPIDAE